MPIKKIFNNDQVTIQDFNLYFSIINFHIWF